MTSMTPADDRAFAAATSALRKTALVAAPTALAPAVFSPAVPLPARRSSARLGDIAAALRQHATAALSHILPPLAVVALLLLVWELSAGGPGSSVPSPSRIWSESSDLIRRPFFVGGQQDYGLGWRVLLSLERVAAGFGLAVMAGIALGVAIGQSVYVSRALDPICQTLRTIPPLAWLPVALAAFRDSFTAAVFVMFITSVWPIAINTVAGVRSVPQDYRNVARLLRLSPLEVFWRIVIPAAAPHIFAGLRIGLGLSWLGIVAAEMLTGGVGIGAFMRDAWSAARLPDVVVALVYIGLAGFMLDRAALAAGHFATHRAAGGSRRMP